MAVDRRLPETPAPEQEVKLKAHERNRQGVAAYGRGDHEEAIAAFTEVIGLLKAPPHADGEGFEVAMASWKKELAVTRTNLARARLASGQLQAAEKDALEAAELDLGYKRARTVLAEIYRKQGRLADAEALLKALQFGPSCEDQWEKFKVLPKILRAAARRSLLAHALMLSLLTFAVFFHRRLAAEAFAGVERPMDVDEIGRTLRFTSGYGFANSFRGRLHAEHVEDAVSAAVFAQLRPQDWAEFAIQVFGAKEAQGGRLLLLSWQKDKQLKLEKRSGKGSGSRSSSTWVGMLAFLPQSINPAAAMKKLAKLSAHGRFMRLGRKNRKWLERKSPIGISWSVEDGGLLPVVLDVHGAVPDEEQLPGRFIHGRVLLVLAFSLALFLSWGVSTALFTWFDFRRHPVLRTLCAPGTTSTLDMAWIMEQELQESESIAMPLVRDDGRIILTLSWFIHCPGSRDFLSRLSQPLFMLADPGTTPQAGQANGSDGTSSQGAGSAPPSVKGLLRRSLTVLLQLPSWLRLLRQSLPGSIQLSMLYEVQLRLASEPQASAAQRAKAAGLKEVQLQSQIIFWNPRNSSFAGFVADHQEVEELAKDAAARQAVLCRIQNSLERAHNGGQVTQMVEGGVDPRSMTRDMCYEELQITSEKLKSAISTSKEEAKKQLARAFTLRVLQNKSAEKEKVERVALAFDLLLRRVCLSLEL